MRDYALGACGAAPNRNMPCHALPHGLRWLTLAGNRVHIGAVFGHVLTHQPAPDVHIQLSNQEHSKHPMGIRYSHEERDFGGALPLLGVAMGQARIHAALYTVRWTDVDTQQRLE